MNLPGEEKGVMRRAERIRPDCSPGRRVCPGESHPSRRHWTVKLHPLCKVFGRVNHSDPASIHVSRGHLKAVQINWNNSVSTASGLGLSKEEQEILLKLPTRSNVLQFYQALEMTLRTDIEDLVRPEKERERESEAITVIWRWGHAVASLLAINELTPPNHKSVNPH